MYPLPFGRPGPGERVQRHLPLLRHGQCRGRGDLPNVASAGVVSPSAGKLEFSWTDNSGKGNALATDKAFVAAYCEELKDWEYRLDLAARSAGTCTLDITPFSGKDVQTYFGFVSANGKDVTDTIFTGLVTV